MLLLDQHCGIVSNVFIIIIDIICDTMNDSKILFRIMPN